MTLTYSTDWTDLDFRPAPPGWRILHLDLHEGPAPMHDHAEPCVDGYSVVDMPGWLIQVEERYVRSSGLRCDDRPLADRPRRFVAARDCGGELMAANLYGDFWYVLAPSDRLPTADEAAAEVAADAATAAAIRERVTS